MKRWACVILLACVACESPPQSPSASMGTIEVMIGPTRLELGYDNVKCGEHIDFEDSSGAVVLQVSMPDGVADSNSALGVGAIAYLKNIDIDGRNYERMMLVGMPAKHGAQFNCELEAADKGQTLTCNNVSVRPWFSPTPVPKGAFRAAFQCTKTLRHDP